MPDAYDRFLESQPPKLREKSRIYNDTAEERGRRIISYLGDVAGKLVLDVGSGTGGIALAFARAGAVIHAVEPQKTLRDITAGRLAEFEGAKVYGSLLEVDGRFDFMVMNDVLEHIERVDFDGMFALLKPGGRIWIATPNRLSPQQILKEGHSGLFGVGLLPEKAARFYVEKVRRAMPRYDVHHIYTYGGLTRALKKHGMKFEMIEEYKPARHFWRVRPAFVRLVLSNLVAHQLRPGFFEMICHRD